MPYVILLSKTYLKRTLHTLVVKNILAINVVCGGCNCVCGRESMYVYMRIKEDRERSLSGGTCGGGKKKKFGFLTKIEPKKR